MRSSAQEIGVLCGPWVAAAVWLVPTTAWAQPADSCALSLSIEAADEDTLQLRQELVAGLLGEITAPSCADARVSVIPASSGLVVSVDQGGRSVVREVDSLHHAALWIESWLVPVGGVPSTNPPAEGVALEAVTEDDVLFPGAPPPPRHHVETRLALEMAISVGGDQMVWFGPDLTVTALLTPSFWLGGALGLSFWAQDDLAGVTMIGDVPVLRAALRAGGRLRFSERLSLDLGGGLGLTWDSQISKPVNPFVEALVALEVALGRDVSFLFGLLGRLHFIREASRLAEVLTAEDAGGAQGELPALSILAGELRLGFSYTFGRAR